MNTLTVHRYPTEVHAGAGALDGYLAHVARDCCAVLYDPAISSPGLDSLVNDSGVPTRTAPASPDLDAIVEVSQWVGAVSPTHLVAVGGGTTMDVAKAAHAMADDPSLRGRIARTASRAGALPLHSTTPTRRSRSLAVAATTFGTGSEVSPVVSVGVPSPHGPCRVLVSGLDLAPDTAILDPSLTSTLPSHLGRYGIFEILARAVGADVGSVSSIPTASAEALSLAVQACDLLDTAARDAGLDSSSRLAASLLSAQSHLGWALQGRPPAPSPLWVICDEVASTIGCTKLEATAWLWPHWLRAVKTHGMPWGDPQRLQRHANQALRGADDRDTAQAQLNRWGIPTESMDMGPHDPDDLAARIIARWGAPLPMLRGFTRESIAAFFAGAQ
ncbi:MAG: iron-containing alcohol dehydrogenase [Bifidobacteriaceae bacterium]|nr:iron-containing alcohol dehydrogenase [Bifidobacteriaceae bacterium]